MLTVYLLFFFYDDGFLDVKFFLVVGLTDKVFMLTVFSYRFYIFVVFVELQITNRLVNINL